MRSYRLYLIVLMALLVVLVACGKTAVPPVATPLATPAVVTTQVPTNTPAATSGDEVAWAKVVEAAKKEGAVTVYSSGFVADIGRRITQDFRNKFGIRVEILPGAGGGLVERIKLERSMKNQIADVYASSGFNSTTDLVVSGGAEKIVDELPALRDKGVFKADPVYSPGSEMVNFAIQYGGTPIINSNLVKPENEPRSYNDLLAPQWKGKMISTDPRLTGSSSLYYILRYHKVLDLDYYRRLAQQDMALWAANPREAAMMVARGEYPIFLGGTNELIAPIVAQGVPLKILTMEEGVTVSPGGTTVVVKGAPHPNAARVFVNWLLSPEGQLSYAESSSTSGIRKDVPDFLDSRARIQPKIVWPSTWEAALWMREDMEAKTMEQIFGKK